MSLRKAMRGEYHGMTVWYLDLKPDRVELRDLHARLPYGLWGYDQTRRQWWIADRIRAKQAALAIWPALERYLAQQPLPL